MADDLATLGLRLTNEQAIADAKATGAAFEDMGVKGETAQKKLASSSSPVEAAIRRQAETAQFLAAKQAEATAINDRLGTSQQKITQYMAQAAAEQRKMTLMQIEAIAINEKQAATTVASTRGLSAWAALQAEATGHVGEHNLAVGRLERALANIVGHFLGANAAVELLGSGLLKFAIGGIETAAILGGIALIIAIYEHFTSATHEAEKAQDDLLKKMREVEAQKLAGGIEGQTATAAQDRVDAAVRALDVLRKVSATVDKPGQLSGVFLGNVGGRTKEQQTVIDDAVKELAVAMANRDEVYTKGAQTQDRAFTSDLAALIAHNHATAAERANALTLLKADREALAKLPSADVAGRAALSAEIEKLSAPFKAEADAADAAIKRAQEDFLRYQQLVRSTSFSPLSLDYARTAAGMRNRTTENTMTDKEQIALLAPLEKSIQDEIKNTTDAAVSLAIRTFREGIGKELTDRARDIVDRNKRMLNEIQRDFSTFFTDIFTKGIKSFGDLFSSIKDMFLKLMAEMLAADLMRKLAGTIGALGAVFGMPATAGAQAATTGAAGFIARHGGAIEGAGIGLAGFGVGSALGASIGNAGGGAVVGAAGGAAAGAALGTLGGPVGVLTGALIGGAAGLVGGLLGGASAAREAAAAMRQLQKDYTAALMTFKHDDLGAALAKNAADAEALRAQAEKLFGTFDAIWQDIVNNLTPGSKITGANADIAAQEAKNAATIQRQAQYAQEDLVVRNMRATGQGDQADLLAFQEKQQREYQAALDANKDQLYLNTLQTTLNNELIAFQNGLLQDAIRNSPNGFRVDPYLYNFQTPRGSPANGGPAGGSGGPTTDPNGTSGFTPPGGSRGRPPLPTQTIILTVDGKVLTKVVVNNLDQKAAATNGAGSSRSDVLNVYN